jgi:predicted transglutaminase-like cysteine proteinase
MPGVIIDQAHWTQLEQVQMQVDQKVRYESDMQRFGVEDWWEPATDKGDCEDIVLAKRQKLMDLGWPADALRIAVVVDGHGDLHAVLTVDAQSVEAKPVTYVLDNHFEHVEPWQVMGQYGYVWLERSKPGSTQWSRLDNGTAGETVRIASLATQVMVAPRWGDDGKPMQVQMAQAAPAPVQVAQAPAAQTVAAAAQPPIEMTLNAQGQLVPETPQVATTVPESAAVGS